MIMSIIIPSKNIYDIKNPVIRDNIISQVKIDTTKVLPDIYEYEKPVYREFQNITEGEELTVPSTEPDREFSFEYDTVIEQVGIGLVSYYKRFIVAACSLYRHTKSNKINITIPKHQGFSCLKKIYYGEENNIPEIKYSLYGDVYEGDVRGLVRIKGEFSNITEVGVLNSFAYSEAEKIESDTLLRVPPSISITEDYTTLGTGVSGSEQKISATSNTNIYYSNSVFNTKFDDLPNEDSFSLSFEILQETKLLNLSGMGSFSDSVNTNVREFDITGKYKSFKATRAEITIYGDTIGISLEDGTITYGTGNKPYTLNGSELTQNNPKQLAESVLSQYENGKETATILCDINDFRHDNGVLAISPNPLKDVALKFIASLEDENDVRYINHTFEVVRGEIRQNDELRYSQIIQYTALNSATQGNQITLCEMKSEDTYYFESGKIYDFSFAESVELPMTFEIGDWVIPMVKNPNSPTKDMPMSKKSDRTAKPFRVVGIDFVYNGAVWQKLSLQEV